MKNHSTFLQGLVNLSMSVQKIDWSFIDFLMKICLVIAGIVCVCHYDPALTRPLMLWVVVGFLVFLALIIATLAISALVARCRVLHGEMIQDRIRFYENQIEKVIKK